MPKIKKPLERRLTSMAEDIQIGGDVHFRSMACAVVLGEATATLTDDQRKDMERLLKRADRLLDDLLSFWSRHPELERVVNRGKVCASDGLEVAERELRKKEKPT